MKKTAAFWIIVILVLWLFLGLFVAVAVTALWWSFLRGMEKMRWGRMKDFDDA